MQNEISLMELVECLQKKAAVISVPTLLSIIAIVSFTFLLRPYSMMQ